MYLGIDDRYFELKNESLSYKLIIVSQNVVFLSKIEADEHD